MRSAVSSISVEFSQLGFDWFLLNGAYANNLPRATQSLSHIELSSKQVDHNAAGAGWL